MRYTHPFKLIRRRKHTLKISLIITLVLIFLILVLGYTFLDAEQFFWGFLSSFVRVSIAYSIALIFAVLLALGLTTSKKLEAVFLPILDVLQSFPSFALFPLFVIWFGRSSIVTIFILVITMIWPILFTILSSQKQIREDLIEAATIFKAKGFKYIIYVLFPLLFSGIITGSIVAWGEAWEAIIAAEIIVRVFGVGTYLANLGDNNQKSALMVGVFLLLGILFIFNKYVWLPLLNRSVEYQQE